MPYVVVKNEDGFRVKKLDDNTYMSKKPLTKEKIKTYKGFENISEEEAEEILTSIDTLCQIIYGQYQNQKRRKSHER